LLDESDASVLDDIIVWWVDDERFDVMPNASNTSRVVGSIGGDDVTADGPSSPCKAPRLASSCRLSCRTRPPSPDSELRPSTGRAPPAPWPAPATRGEDGVECAVPAAVAESFWNAVVDTGITPAGLGARDTLRLEVALPLHGHELRPGITSVAGWLGWVVSWDKPTFQGRAALESERAAGPKRRLRGLEFEGRQPPRQGYGVNIDGHPAGEITSGNFSPTLERGIALAFLPPRLNPASKSKSICAAARSQVVL